MAALKILLPLLIFGALWFVSGTTATTFGLSENLDQLTQLLVRAALTFVGVFALMLAWAFISLRNRNKKSDWSWNKKFD
jgi:membrane protein DedA with SNARE-associated domain